MAVGRVMTCVLGMVVRRSGMIRNFVKTPFYRVLAKQNYGGRTFDGEWRARRAACIFNPPCSIRKTDLRKKRDAQSLVKQLEAMVPREL